MKVESDGEGGTGQKGSKGSSGKRTMRGVRAKVRPRMSVGMLFTNDLQCQNEWFAVYMQVLALLVAQPPIQGLSVTRYKITAEAMLTSRRPGVIAGAGVLSVLLVSCRLCSMQLCA